MQEDDYRNCEKDYKYYGSDLNKHVDKKCTRQMTCINADTLIFRRSYKTLKLMESKYPTEGMKWGQYEVLRFLGWLFKKINGKTKFERIESLGINFPKIYVYVVYGEPPYDKINVVNLTEEHQYYRGGDFNKIYVKPEKEYTGDDVRRFLECEI